MGTYVVLCVGMVVFSLSAQAATINVIVDGALEPSISSALETYRTDLVHDGYEVAMTTWTTGSAEDLRTHLQAMKARPQGLDGAVFVGQLPPAYYYKASTYGGASETWPIDLFHTDLDGTWSDGNGDGIYDGHSGSVTPDIWLGRIHGTTSGDQSVIINDYLGRVHDFKTGVLSFPEKAVFWSDDDWSGYWAGVWSNELRNAYPGAQTTVYDNPAITSLTHWKDLATGGSYEFWHQCIHSFPGGFHISHPTDGGWVMANEIPALDPQIGFYNFFDCSYARYTDTGYWGVGALESVFHTSAGLAGVGSTKTGGMWRGSSFYATLGAGGTMGEALKNWFSVLGADGYNGSEVDWFYGMTLLGDPTLGPHTAYTTIPEPGTVALFLVGLAGFCLRRRRNR